MGGKDVHELVLLDQAGRALAEAKSLDEIKVIRDKAEAVRKYAQSASLGLDVQNRAAEVKLRAERQAGNLLSQLLLRGGDRRSKVHNDRLKLVDLGLTANQSKRWQLQARVPENLFRQYIKQVRDDSKELTSAGLMRLAKRLKGPPAKRNGHAGTNGNAVAQHDSNGNGKLTAQRRGKWDEQSPVNALCELVNELKNHHEVLDGILRPLYSNESVSLHRAELRMLRYLLAETSGLLKQLEKLGRDSQGCMCREDRGAI